MNITHMKGWKHCSLGSLIYSLWLQEWWRWSALTSRSTFSVLKLEQLPPTQRAWYPCLAFLLFLGTGFSLIYLCPLIPCFMIPPTAIQNIVPLLVPPWPHSRHPFQPSLNPITPTRIKVISESFFFIKHLVEKQDESGESWWNYIHLNEG